ncbi:MAG: glycosyltransferase family 39 protein [Pirellulales bacterium]|nr:glycosyltransferase family 39 protein [Pirellulales bacterium]
MAAAALFAYLIAYTAVMSPTFAYLPAYAAPQGDEVTYVTQALRPWTLRSELFEGFRPKELVNPFNLRGFLTPLALVLAGQGFSIEGPRWVVFAYGLLLLTVVFAVARTMATSWIAAAVAVLFSLTPAFVYFSHVVRPEALLSAGFVAMLGLVAQPASARPWRDYLLGFLASALVWVHYNGIIALPLAAALVTILDRPGERGIRLRRMALGAGLFAVLYAVVNLWPGRQFIAEYGPWPVTFVSRSDLPIGSARWLSHGTATLEIYKGLLSGTWDFEHQTGWLTLGLAMVGMLGCLWSADRAGRVVVLGAAGLLLAQVLIIPNAKSEYLFYVYPLVMLALAGLLGQTIARWRVPAMAALVGSGLAYGSASWELIETHRSRLEQNRTTSQVLAVIVDRNGPRDQTTVIGPQAFYAATHGVRYRTVHAIAETQTVAGLLELHRPKVVILTADLVNLMDELRHWPRASGGAERHSRLLQEHVHGELERRNYRRFEANLYWNGQPVHVYERDATAGQAQARPAGAPASRKRRAKGVRLAGDRSAHATRKSPRRYPGFASRK